MKRLLVVLALMLPVLAFAQEAEKPDVNGHFVLNHVNLIDGVGDEVQEGMAVEVKDGKIVDIYKAGERDFGDAMVIDLPGCYLLPGLIDAHVHFSHGTLQGNIDSLEGMLMGGVTSVRDMAGDGRRLALLKRDAAVGDIDSPDIYFSTVLGGPTFFTDPRVQDVSQAAELGNTSWARAITEETDLRQVVAEAKGIGATALKIYADLSPDLVRKLTEEAHRQGLKAWSHGTVFPAGPMDCIEAGVDVLSHSALLYYEMVDEIPASFENRYNHPFTFESLDNDLYKNLFARVVEKGTILDATVLIFILGEPAEKDTNKERMAEFSNEITRLAHKYGVKISAGTDLQLDEKTGLPMLHREMAALVEQCGMTPMEVIKSATMIAAETIGIEDTIGSVEVGKDADLLVLLANPLDDIANTAAIKLIVKNGKIYLK